MKAISNSEIRTGIPLIVIGYDFRSASSILREKLVSTEKGRKHLFNEIRKLDNSAGILILETCNRLEWIVSTRLPEWIAEILKARMIDLLQRHFPELEDLPSPYIYTEKEAVIHVLRVVVGLESLATGEAQIAGQFHSALKNTQKEKTSSPVINRLGHIAGRIAKSGYKIGFRSNYRQGIHGMAVKYLSRIFPEDLNNKKVIVAGMGEIGKKVVNLLEESVKCEVIPVNRTIKPAHKKIWFKFTNLKELSKNADAIIIATGAHSPVLNESMITHNSRISRFHILDLGIPRQVSESLRKMPEVKYSNIDDLLELGESRNDKIHLADLDKEIMSEYRDFRQFCRSREMSAILSEIHSGRLELTHNRIPDFVKSELSVLGDKKRKQVEKSLNKFILDYSSNLFKIFHKTMDDYWRNNNNGN